MSAADAHEHHVVGGHRRGCQLAIARWIQSRAHHVSHSPYRHGAPIDVIAAKEDDAHPIFHEGGHFPAMEVPDLLVGDVREFFRGLR